jgi:hypothetical protein
LHAERPGIEHLLAKLSVLAVCTWTGYFLAHDWQTLDVLRLCLLLGGVVGCAVGSELMGRQRLTGGAGLIAPALLLLGPAAMALADLRALVAAAVLISVAVLGRTTAGRTVAGRVVLDLLGAAAAMSAGLVDFLPLTLSTGYAVFTLAAYVAATGLACGGPAAVPRGRLGLAVGIPVAIALMVGAVGMTRPFGLLSAAFGLWLALRLVLYGRRVLSGSSSARPADFAVLARFGTGLLAGALLTLSIDASAPPPGGPEGRMSAELAWPVAAGAFSFLAMRIWAQVYDGGIPGFGRRKVRIRNAEK